MNQVSGALSPKPLSKVFRNIRSQPNSRVLALLEIIFLISLGVAAVMLHNHLRWSLRLPGSHGLEWMALLIIGRASSRRSWAASLSGLGAAGMATLPLWGPADPFRALTYLAPGLLVDLLFRLGTRWQANILFLAFAAALGHATKPMIRSLIALSGTWQYASLLNGLLYPLATHLLFGFAGGLFGALMMAGIKRMASRHRSR